MHTFSTLTFLFAVSAAVPHSINHFRLHHERALQADALALKPLVERDVVTTNLAERQVSPFGQCGGSSGFRCAPGFCCSQYGYCGTGPSYCGSGGSGSGSPSGHSPHNPYHGSPTATGRPSSPTSAPTHTPHSPHSGGGGGSGGGSSGGLGNTYKMYSGNGSPGAGWPSEENWMDFESLWNANLPAMSESCANNGWGADNSQTENAELKSAIQSIGGGAGIDPRLILAIVMQESEGCVRVITTNNGVVNPGLMQSHDGSGSCNSNGNVQTPCPAKEITQMIKDGTEGTPSGDGLKQTLSQCNGADISQKYYQAATIYNSGNLPENLDDNTATACYASDIANRLTGWTTAQNTCNL